MEKPCFPSEWGILRQCKHPKAVNSKYTSMAEGPGRGVPGAGPKLQQTVCSPTVGKPHLSALGAAHLEAQLPRGTKGLFLGEDREEGPEVKGSAPVGLGPCELQS